MNGLRFHEDYALNYVRIAPAALAFERILECAIYRQFVILPPVLDLGCGDGLFSQLLFMDPIDVGLDPNPEEIQSAKQTHAYKELICCYGNQIPRDNESFNTVISNSVLEHIADLEPVLLEVHRILKPGGLFYLTIPTDQFERYAFVSRLLSVLGMETMARGFGGFYNRFWRHYHAYSPEQWEERWTRIGFCVDARQEYGAKNICTLHDLMTFVAFPAFLSKKLLNRWIVSQSLRRLYAPLVAWFGRWSREKWEKSTPVDRGGLVFFVLRKSS